MPRFSFKLTPKPPFRLDMTVWALRRMPHNAVDRWDGRAYTRIIVLDRHALQVEVTQPDEKHIRVHVQTGQRSAPHNLKERVTSVIEKALGIRKDLREFYTVAAQDKWLNGLVHLFRGLKPPRFPTAFEALINSIACQQLSLNVGITLLNRLSQAYGKAWTENGESMHAFPLPEELASTTFAKLRRLGFSTNKAGAIIALARSVQGEQVNLESVDTMSDEEAMEFLLARKGIGRWSAEYVLLRGLGRLNVFPGDDVGAQKNLQTLLRLKVRPDYERIRQIVRRWQPYAGFVYFHFLLHKLRTKGLL